MQRQLSEREGQLREKAEEHKKLVEMTVVSKKEEGREESSSSPLASIGKRCLGEKHQEMIQSQSIAIGELRKKMNDLISTSPPGVLSRRERERERERERASVHHPV